MIEFWKALSISLLILIGAGSQIIINGMYAGTVLRVCEEEIPRNQKCRIAAEVIPNDTNTNR